MSTYGTVFACGVLIAFGRTAALAAPGDIPAVTATLLPDATAHVPYGKASGEPTLTLMVTGLDPATPLDPKVQDVSSSETTVGEIRKTLRSAESATRIWTLTLPVRNLPRNAPQTRVLLVTLPTSPKPTSYTLSYTLTNQSAQAPQLSLKPPPAGLALGRSPWIPVGATVVGSQGLTGVKLLQPTVIEKSLKRLSTVPALQLCRGSYPAEYETKTPPPANCAGEKGFPLDANSATVLWLGPTDAVGAYDNQTITIASDQKPDGDPVALTFFVSSGWHKLGGIVAIILGVAVGWVPMYMRGRMARDQAMLPVFAAQEALDNVISALNAHTAIAAPQTRARIAEQQGFLATKELLRHGLPPVFGSPFTAAPAGDVQKFRDYVQGVNNWALALGSTIAGMVYVSQWANDTRPGVKPAVTAAIQGLEAIAGFMPAQPPPKIDDVRTAVNGFRQAVDTAVAKATGLGVAPPVSSVPPASAERELRVQIAMLNTFSWLLVGIVTVTVGAYVLLFSSLGAGFGTAMNFLEAFFWGIGLPAAAGLSNATTAKTLHGPAWKPKRAVLSLMFRRAQLHGLVGELYRPQYRASSLLISGQIFHTTLGWKLRSTSTPFTT